MDRMRFARVCDAIVLTLVILVLLLTPFAFGGVDQTKALLERTFLSPVLFYSVYFARLGIVLTVLLWLVKLIVSKEVRFTRTPLDIPILLFVAYAFLWFFFSKSRSVTGGELANVVSYATLFLVVANTVKTRLQMNVIVGVLICSGFLMAAIGLIQSSGYFLPSSGLKYDYAVNLVRPEQYWGRVGGTFVCPNHFAGYLEMIIPFALSYVLFSKVSVGRKILIVFCGVTMIMGLLLSISRGGWVGFGASVVFLFAMISKQKKVPVAAWLVPLVVILLGAGVVVASSERVRDRFSQSFSTEDASYLKRMHVWLDTTGLIRDHLLVGTGPGTFETAYRAYRRPSVMLAIRYTHNDYLHALSDYGAIGFGIILSGIFAFSRKMWKLTDRLKRRNDRALAYGVMGAVVAILVHSFIDFNMHIPSNAMTMAVIVGLGMSLRHYRVAADDEWVALSEQKARVFPLALQVGLIAVVLAATVGVLFLNFRAYASSLVMHRAAEKDPSREFDDPSRILSEQDPLEKDMESAKKGYRKSASLFPSNPKPWEGLASMHLRKASFELVREEKEAKEEAKAKGDEYLKKVPTKTDVEKRRADKRAELFLWQESQRFLARGLKNRFYVLLYGGRKALEDYGEAAAAAREAIKRNPLDSRHYLTLARAYAGIVFINHEYKQGAPREYSAEREKYGRMAETQFQKALELDPNNAFCHEAAGFFYYRTRRYDEAERQLRQALEIMADEPAYAKERRHLERLLKEIRDKQAETSEVDSAL